IPTCLASHPKESCSRGREQTLDRTAEFAAVELGVGPVVLADVDGDGLTDAIVGLRALQERAPVAGRKTTAYLVWSATAFLLGNGASSHIADDSFFQVRPSGFFYYMPLALIRIGGCTFVVTNHEDKDLLFLAQPKESSGCSNRMTRKWVENLGQ